MKPFIFILFLFPVIALANNCQNIIIGAANTQQYFPLLKNKNLAIFANRASIIESQNIVDFLIQHKFKIKKIFSGEHGFEINTDAGHQVNNSAYHNIPVISLYGEKKSPSPQDLKSIDLIVFDIQDVGVRFFTYISSLQLLLAAAIKSDTPVFILDRPNPNSFYIDGPVLDAKYKSFVGMQEIPIVYGMTIGEYANMLLGEKKLDPMPSKQNKHFKLIVIPLTNYQHNCHYQLNTPPSPNLPSMAAIYWYPSLALFEGTQISVGRGTKTPFTVLGYPNYKSNFSFIPRSMLGAKKPPYLNQTCHGINLNYPPRLVLNRLKNQLNLKLLADTYQSFKNKNTFFNNYFNLLAGNSTLQQQIVKNISESEIRQGWEPALKNFKITRSKYLLYP